MIPIWSGVLHVLGVFHMSQRDDRDSPTYSSRDQAPLSRSLTEKEQHLSRADSTVHTIRDQLAASSQARPLQCRMLQGMPTVAWYPRPASMAMNRVLSSVHAINLRPLGLVTAPNFCGGLAYISSRHTGCFYPKELRAKNINRSP